MKIQYASDIHLELSDNSRFIKSEPFDVTGDVLVFADTENAVDCKSHFPYIAAKVDFGAENFIKAVRDALEEQSKHPNGEVPTTKAKKLTKKEKDETLEEHVSVTDDEADELRDMGAVILMTLKALPMRITLGMIVCLPFVLVTYWGLLMPSAKYIV